MNNQPATPIISRFRGKPQPKSPQTAGFPAPHTSQEAAERVRPYVPTQHARVLRRIQDMGAFGATRDELSTHLKMRLSSVCGRVRELLDLDEVEVAVIRRKNQIGSNVEVLVVAKGGDA